MKKIVDLVSLIEDAVEEVKIQAPLVGGDVVEAAQDTAAFVVRKADAAYSFTRNEASRILDLVKSRL